MPRSSGGGSSSSGGHSGSSSSSHSSSSSSGSSSSSSHSSSSSSGSSSSSSDSYSRSGNSGSANFFESNYFEGARCFVYYRERKPVFIYSKDDPYEMGKGKIVFIVIGLPLIIASFFSFDKGLSEFGPGFMCFMVGSMFLLMSGSVPRFGPKELTEIKINKANPKTEACPYCGYTIASNVHETCPHCESKLELKPYVEDEQKAQQTNLSAKGFAEVNSDTNNPTAETLIQQNPSIAETCLENNANCDDRLIPDAAKSNESRVTNRQIRKNITGQSNYDRKWYAYYEKNKMYLLCANDDLSVKYSDPKLETRIKKIIVAAVLLIAAWATTLDKREPAVKRVYGCRDNSVIVEDNADVLDDKQEEKLKEVLDDFSCSTGVPVAFFTENNSTWRSEYPNMIDYAYDVYVNHFEDEYHWVLIYSQSQDGDVDHPSWYWEGMQGDYTDKVLDIFLEEFNKQVQSQLEAGDSVYKTFTDSFNAATYSFKHQPQPIRPTMLKLHILSAAAGIAFLLWSFKSIKYNREELIDLGRNQKPATTRCPNCNHTILAYMHDKCPHCGKDI